MTAKCDMIFLDDKKKKEEQQLKEFTDFKSHPELVDPLLHDPDGHKECLDQQDLMYQFDFIKIFVSPHRRTIQTTLDLLKSHP